MSAETLTALTGPEFTRGLLAGFAALGLGLLVGLVWKTRRSSAPPIGGALFVVAAVGVLSSTRPVPGLVVGALVVLAIGGWAASLIDRSWAMALGAAPGAALLGVATGGQAWKGVAVWLAVWAGATLAADADQRRARWSPPWWAVTVVGVFFTVPDTERLLTLLGVAVPLALLTFPRVLATLGSWALPPAVGLLLWAAAEGAADRPASMLGAALCLGLFVMEPIAVRWRRASALDAIPPTARGAVVAGLAQLAVVFPAARVVGLQRALALGVLSAVALVAVSVWLLTLEPRVRQAAD